MERNRIEDEYFDWMTTLICNGRRSKITIYKKLLKYLHQVDFRYKIKNDWNRAEDGVDLRFRFAGERRHKNAPSDFFSSPCSVLEMLTALAIRCEEHIMWDPDIGDRTGKWFWDMIDNLGLSSMTNDQFDDQYVKYKLDVFMDRKYKKNGDGGLFVVSDPKRDMRKVEIGYQMCWYLDEILRKGENTMR